MTSQVYYRKWRPQQLAEVAGQAHVTQTLLNALKNGRISHAYLFCGPRGTGKTSTGRILAKAVNCLDNGQGEPCNTCEMCQAVTQDRALDVIEIDAASNRGIDDIRELREKVNYAPNRARYKVYIIDEVHMLSKDASNALLKTLEEPPPHVIFILATTEAHKVLPTIISRCQYFNFRRISQADVVDKLGAICKAEGIRIEPAALNLIARSSTGSLRDAENLLEQLTTYYGLQIGLNQAQAVLGITGDCRAREVVKNIVDNNISAGMATLASVNNDGLDLRQFNREVVDYLRSLLLMKTGSTEVIDLTAEGLAELKALVGQISLSRVLQAIKLFGQIELGTDNHSTLPLELALVDCFLFSGGEKETPAAKVEPEPSTSKPASMPNKQLAGKPGPVAKARPVEPVVVSSVVKEPAPVSAPELSSEIERLRLNWKQILEEVPADIKKSNATALLRSAGIKPSSVEGNTVVLSVRYSIYKDKMEKSENQQVAERIISGFLGRPCRVRCIHEPDSNHLVKAVIKMGAQVTSVEEK